MAFIPSSENDQTGIGLYQVGKGDSQVLDTSMMKTLVESMAKQREHQQALKEHEAAQKEQQAAREYDMLSKHLDTLPNDVWALKDESLKQEHIKNISDIAYNNPALYDPKASIADKMKARATLNTAINAEKSGAMQSAQFQKRQILYEKEINDHLKNGGTLDDYYNAKEVLENSDPSTAGKYDDIKPMLKADIDEWISSPKGLRTLTDQYIQNNKGKPLTQDAVDALVGNTLRQSNKYSVRNAHDWANEEDADKKKDYLAKYPEHEAMVQYGIDKHRGTSQYLVGVNPKTEHPANFYNNGALDKTFQDQSLVADENGYIPHYGGENKFISVTNDQFPEIGKTGETRQVRIVHIPKAGDTNPSVVVEVQKTDAENKQLDSKFNEASKAYEKASETQHIPQLMSSLEASKAVLTNPKSSTSDKDLAQQNIDSIQPVINSFNAQYKKPEQPNYAVETKSITKKPNEDYNTWYKRANSLFSSVHKYPLSDAMNGKPPKGVYFDNSNTGKNNSVSSQPKSEQPKSITIDVVKQKANPKKQINAYTPSKDGKKVKVTYKDGTEEIINL